MTTAPVSSTRRATLEKFWFAFVMETKFFPLIVHGKTSVTPWRGPIQMAGQDTPESIYSGKTCKTTSRETLVEPRIYWIHSWGVSTPFWHPDTVSHIAMTYRTFRYHSLEAGIRRWSQPFAVEVRLCCIPFIAVCNKSGFFKKIPACAIRQIQRQQNLSDLDMI